jgi:hypothetical protein
VGFCEDGLSVKAWFERENVLLSFHERLEKVRRKSVKENADFGQNENDYHP